MQAAMDKPWKSLADLRLDYLDLYLVHWPNENVPIEETMKALEHCVDEGYTRFIGVSNFSTKLLEEAQFALKENRLIANQVKYSLVEQGPKTEHIPYCVENDITLIAYTPLARGILTRESNPVLVEMAEKYDKSPAQISLNWVISQENVITIPKASRLEHLRDNLGAVGWRMDAGDADIVAKSFS